MAADRVIVYLDWQNVFKTALETFPAGSSGNVHPLQLANRLAKKPPTGLSGARDLVKVKIYRGLPNPRKEPRTNSAAQKQHAAWTGRYPSLVELNLRPLAYRKEDVDDGTGKIIKAEISREKGVDVQLAIDMVRDSIFSDPRECDVAILFSEDSDFEPALELLVDKRGRDAVEVARWCHDRRYPPDPPKIRGVKLRQHLLDVAFYNSIEDRASYGY